MIRVLYNYGGRNTNERRIEPGEYDENDPRLFGCGDDLLKSGHAVRVTVTTAPGGDVLVMDSKSEIVDNNSEVSATIDLTTWRGSMEEEFTPDERAELKRRYEAAKEYEATTPHAEQLAAMEAGVIPGLDDEPPADAPPDKPKGKRK